MRFRVNRAFLVGFNDKILHTIGLKKLDILSIFRGFSLEMQVRLATLDL